MWADNSSSFTPSHSSMLQGQGVPQPAAACTCWLEFWSSCKTLSRDRERAESTKAPRSCLSPKPALQGCATSVVLWSLTSSYWLLATTFLSVFFPFSFPFFLFFSPSLSLSWKKSPVPQNLPPTETGISKLYITMLTLCFPTGKSSRHMMLGTRDKGTSCLKN